MLKGRGRMHTEVIIEAIVTLAILIIVYFGLMFVLIAAYEQYFPVLLQRYPTSILVLPEIQQNFFLGFTILYFVLSIFFIIWRMVKRRRTIQLGYILNELHFISKGNYDHRIAINHMNSMEPVVNSINRLVDSTVKAMEEERRIEQSKDELIANMSHDIRTPLTSIIGYLGLLEQGRYQTESEGQSYIGIAYKKSLQMHKMVDDLFEYTKVRQTHAKLDISEVNLSRMLEQLVVEFSIEAENVGREMQLVVMSDNELLVEIDDEQIVRVFSNLITNAFKYGGDGDFVRITAKQDEKKTIITVANDGNQIPADSLKSLFERFYRVEQSRSVNTGGSGLGLAISDSIIQLHHGEIYAESDEESTRIVFIIPNKYESEVEEGA